MKQALVVDDTKSIRILLTTCLEVEGFLVQTAVNGEEALNLLRSGKFDLVFLDIKLPEVSGTEVLRQLRGLGIMTPIIIMTAFATVKNAVECTRLGAVAYLQKPFTAEKLRQVLTEVKTKVSDQKFVSSFLSYARELIDSGEWEEAFKVVKQALTFDPNRREIYYLLAIIYQAKGSTTEAERFFKIADQFPEERQDSN